MYVPYPLEYNHGVVFFNMSFWVRSNSKNPKKVDFLTKKKNPKNRTYETGGGCNLGLETSVYGKF